MQKGANLSAWEHQVIADGTVGMLARYSFQGS